MTFWTWAKVRKSPSLFSDDDSKPFFALQGLEIRFDRKSRKRIEGFIVPEGAGAIFSELEKPEDGEFVALQERNDGDNCNRTLYFITPPLPEAKGASSGEERRVLSRLPILAIFHGVSHERGVPPSFTSTHARPSPSLRAPCSLLCCIQASCGSGRHCQRSACS